MPPTAGNIADIEKKYLMLNPVNAVSSGVYSASAGLPLIKFDISSTDNPCFIDTSELRINGKLTAKTNAGVQLTAVDKNFYDNFTGKFSNCVETVTIASKRLNQVIERTTNYWRIPGAVHSGLHSENDLNTSFSHEGDHFSTTFLGRHNLVAWDANNKGKTFSDQLFCGCLNSGADMDISRNGFGGLTIEILLKPNVNNVFGTDASTNGVYVELSDLVLTVPMYEMRGASAKSYKKKVNTFSFNGLNSVFQTVNSSTSVIALTPGLSKVSSIFMNFMNANEIGDQRYNSCRLGNLGELRQLRFSVNGLLKPLNYRLETGEQNNNALSSSHTYTSRPMMDRNYLEALQIDRYSKVGRTSLGWNKWNSGVVNRSQTQNRGGTEPGTVEGLGILYDAMGTGEDFSQQVFSAELEVAGTSIDGTANTAQGCYMVFVNQKNVFMSASGIEVQ